MKPDITSFGLGAVALLVGGLALWASYGDVGWSWVGRAAPIVLIVIGIGMLILSRKRIQHPRKGNPK